jgi:protein translocase SecG subunit
MNYLLIAQVVQIVLSVFIVLLSLIQSKGAGLSSTLSGSIGFYRSRRGIEKLVFGSTIVAGILLVANSLLIIFLS